jgi:hypothetical protein
MFRVLNWGMAGLFAVAALLQYNDPDPLRWMAIYTAASIVTAYAAWHRTVPMAAPIVVAAVALIWGIEWSTDVPGLATYAHMFDAWEMKNVAVEEARETGGLMIVTGWMLVLAIHGWRRAAGAGRRTFN